METSQRPRPGRGGARKRIVITECEVTPIDAHGFGAGVRGLATITLNNALVLKGLRIIKDREGELSVAYPAQMGRDKTWHEVVEPKSESLREEISRRVLAEYRRVVGDEAHEEAASEPPATEEELEPSADEDEQEPD